MASSSDFTQQFPGTSKRMVNAEMAADQWPEGQRQDPAANAMAQCAVYSGLRDPRSMVGNPCFEQFGPLFGPRGLAISMVNAQTGSPVLQRRVMTDHNVKIELLKDDLWKEFHPHTTEMVVTKLGRRMFPTLKFQVTGLDPAATYGFYMIFTPTDNFRYKFQHCKWSVNGQCDSIGGSQSVAMYQHPDSPAPGRMWMAQPLSFHRIKLTNCSKDSGDMVVLSSMRKYQPRLVVFKLHQNINGQPLQIVAEFAPPETQFIAVTAYQNPCITRLKVQYNPFAKGFRQTVTTLEPQEPEDLTLAPPPQRKRALSTSGTASTSKKRPSSERDHASPDDEESPERTSTPNYGANRHFDFQLPSFLAPQSRSISPAAAVIKAPITATGAILATDAAIRNHVVNSDHRPIVTPQPLVSFPFPILNPQSPALYSGLFPPPSLQQRAAFMNPLNASGSGLPSIGAFWPNMAHPGPGPYGGLPSGVRFSMY